MTDARLSEMMRAAALGNPAAQSGLVDEVGRAVEAGWIEADEAVILAEPFARMAASHGGKAERLTLMGILLVRAGRMSELGREERAQFYIRDCQPIADGLIAEGCEEAVTAWAIVLDRLADAGDDTAGARLMQLEEQFGPEVMARAAAIDRFALRRPWSGTTGETKQ